jgi:hypothetical protein
MEDWTLEHEPDEWNPVLGKDRDQNKERDPEQAGLRFDADRTRLLNPALGAGSWTRLLDPVLLKRTRD